MAVMVGIASVRENAAEHGRDRSSFHSISSAVAVDLTATAPDRTPEVSTLRVAVHVTSGHQKRRNASLTILIIRLLSRMLWQVKKISIAFSRWMPGPEN
jgi:hypothetical protein